MRLISSIKSILPKVEEEPEVDEPLRGRGEGLAKLHEYQHQVILGLFKINIAGLIAFLLIVLSFTLFTFSDPNAPKWVGFMMISIGTLILLGCYRTIKEFQFYRKNYSALMGQLQAKLRQYFNKTQPSEKIRRPQKTDSRVLSVLKPQEHKGWDSKPCTKCQKSIELMSAICQHCGQEQENILHN